MHFQEVRAVGNPKGSYGTREVESARLTQLCGAERSER